MNKLLIITKALGARLAIMMLMCIFTLRTQATDLYVAPNGNDTNNGSITSPFATIVGARDYIERTGMNQNMTASFHVYLRNGTYPLDDTLVFGPADSGSGGFSIIYTSYPNDAAYLSGGQQITNWTIWQNGIYKASAQGLNFRQLYVDGQRATPARYPNKLGGDFGPFVNTQNFDSGSQQMIVNSGDVSTNWSGINSTLECVIEQRCAVNLLRVASVSKQGGGSAYVTFMSPETNMFRLSAQSGGMRYYFQNSLCLLDAPGEWFLDAPNNTVYYMPRRNEDMAAATVIAPKLLAPLIDINGATNLQFNWLGFEYAGYVIGNNLRVDCQSGVRFNTDTIDPYGYQYVAGTPGAVRLKNTMNIQLNYDRVIHAGGSGIELAYGTHNTLIDHCDITDIGHNGIEVFTDIADFPLWNPSASHASQNDTLQNNLITYVGQEMHDGVGILATFPQNCSITHNEIAYCPDAGILIGWGSWAGYTALKNNSVTYNNIHDVVEMVDDMGCIYTTSWQQPLETSGTQINHNWMHNQKVPYWGEWNGAAPAGGIYLDNNSTGVYVDYNVTTASYTGPDTNRTGINVNTATGASSAGVGPHNNGTIPPAGVGIQSPQWNLPNPPAQSRPQYIASGVRSLYQNDYLQSTLGNYFLLQQSDGNLCIYPRGGGAGLWCSGTYQNGAIGDYVTVMQTDNLCIYNASNNWAGLKCFGPWPSQPKFLVLLENPMNLVVYNGYGPWENYGWVWDKNMTPSGAFSGQPLLSITNSTGQIILSWTGLSSQLQESTNLNYPAGWTDVPAATNSPVALPVNPVPTFFRLITH